MRVKTVRLLAKTISPPGPKLLIFHSRWSLPSCDGIATVQTSKSSQKWRRKVHFWPWIFMRLTIPRQGGKLHLLTATVKWTLRWWLFCQLRFPRSIMKSSLQKQRRLNHRYRVWLDNCVSFENWVTGFLSRKQDVPKIGLCCLSSRKIHQL